jgi:hypothetical protein
MSEAKKPAAEKSFEERKKALIAQGAAQRNNLDVSIAVVRENLHADKLAKSAVQHITAKAFGAVDKLFGRHHVDRVDLSTDLGPDTGVYNTDTGVSGVFAKLNHLSNGDHAAGRLIARARRMLPLAATAFSILRRRRLIMPVLKGAAVLGGVGAGAYFFYRHKQRAQDEAVQDEALRYTHYAEPMQASVLDEQGRIY